MQRYADTGRWPGDAVLIARHGELAFFDCAGHADVEAKRPWQCDLIARIYSMTKPVTAVALMMLYEEAREPRRRSGRPSGSRRWAFLFSRHPGPMLKSHGRAPPHPRHFKRMIAIVRNIAAAMPSVKKASCMRSHTFLHVCQFSAFDAEACNNFRMTAKQ
jgi:hypothetical protein